MNSSGSIVRIVRVRRPRRRSNPNSRVSPSEVLGYLQRAVFNFDTLGFTQGAVMNTGMLISIFRQPPPSENHHYRSSSADSPRRVETLQNRIPLRERIARFLEDRRVYGAPHSLPEFAVLGVIVIVSIWPLLSLVAAMETLR